MIGELTPVVWHDDLEALYARFWDMPLEELRDAEHGGVTDDGEAVALRFEQVIEGVRAQGAWGYCDQRRGEIHAWIAPDCEMGQAVHFLAHELTHATGLDVTGPADLDDEVRAELVGRIARRAYELAVARRRGEGGGE